MKTGQDRYGGIRQSPGVHKLRVGAGIIFS